MNFILEKLKAPTIRNSPLLIHLNTVLITLYNPPIHITESNRIQPQTIITSQKFPEFY